MRTEKKPTTGLLNTTWTNALNGGNTTMLTNPWRHRDRVTVWEQRGADRLPNTIFESPGGKVGCPGEYAAVFFNATREAWREVWA